MLVEILKATRQEGDLTRRWFTSVSLDLYLWQTETKEIQQFQLCHKRPARLSELDSIGEDVLTWTKDVGFRFDTIPDSRGYSSPLLIQSPAFDTTRLKSEYIEEVVGTVANDLAFVTNILLSHEGLGVTSE